VDVTFLAPMLCVGARRWTVHRPVLRYKRSCWEVTMIERSPRAASRCCAGCVGWSGAIVRHPGFARLRTRSMGARKTPIAVKTSYSSLFLNMRYCIRARGVVLAWLSATRGVRTRPRKGCANNDRCRCAEYRSHIPYGRQFASCPPDR